MSLCCYKGQGWDTGATDNTTNNETTATLSVSAKTTHSKSNDGRETDRFEEENDVEHGNTGVSTLGSSRADEDDTHADKDKENPSWLHEAHDTASGESANGKSSLSTGEQLGAETA